MTASLCNGVKPGPLEQLQSINAMHAKPMNDDPGTMGSKVDLNCITECEQMLGQMPTTAPTPLRQAVLRVKVQDFYVEELMPIVPDGVGEHV